MRDVLGTSAAASGDASVVILPLAASARFSLRLRPSAAVEIGQAGGFRLDIPINTCRGTGERMTVRLGPDEWLLLGPEIDSDAIRHDVVSALDGRFFSLVDIGDRDLAVEVAGTHATDVINGGCPIDLDNAAFPAGAATRTLFGKAGIVLMRPGAQRSYRVECLRSFAPYVQAYLQDSAREFMVV
jgi:sarcosine oxidase, subunit gamma